MVEASIAEYFSIGEAIGFIGSMFIGLYFFKKTNANPIQRYRNKDSQ